MSLLFNTIFAWKASGTHHKLALDALTLMHRHDADEWQELFLAEVDRYLKGSKAPDDEFKDFKNHVLHVKENFWGGAIKAAQDWYGKTVQALKSRDWPTAVYNAGVLSHYFTDPMQPFHTGQSERESIIHRAAEWSITKSYNELRTLLTKELGGFPEVACPAGSDWLGELIRQGATRGNEHYEFLIDHYNFELGVKRPEFGMDQESKVIIARQIGFAAASFARVLEKVIAEAGVFVPSVSVSLPALLATAAIPMKFITSKMGDAKERAQVEAMFLEYKQTGKVIDTLPEDDKTIRRLHCEEVLKMPLSELDKQPAGPIGTKYTGAPGNVASLPKKEVASKKAAETSNAEKPVSEKQSNSARPMLRATAKVDDLTAPKIATAKPESKTPDAKPNAPLASIHKESLKETASVEKVEKQRFTRESPVVDAPSIGNKTADRLAVLGIRTVGDFLNASSDTMSKQLRVAHMTTEVLRDWQDQSRLMLSVPGLKGHDAQLLVGVDIRAAEELVNANARDLFEIMEEFCQSNEGKRILRESEPPDLAEIGQWIGFAKKARSSKAA